MAKDEPDRVAVGEQSSKGEHGGNRSGTHKKDQEKKQSVPAAGKDPAPRRPLSIGPLA